MELRAANVRLQDSESAAVRELGQLREKYAALFTEAEAMRR